MTIRDIAGSEECVGMGRGISYAYLLDGGIENFGGEVICSHITTNCNGITASSLDFVCDGLGLLFVEATFVSTMHGTHQHHSFYV